MRWDKMILAGISQFLMHSFMKAFCFPSRETGIRSNHCMLVMGIIDSKQRVARGRPRPNTAPARILARYGIIYIYNVNCICLNSYFNAASCRLATDTIG